MQRTITLLATTIILSPAIALAQPEPGSISPHHETGQQVPPLECEDAGEGVVPGSARNHEAGQGSPFQEDSVSGDHYAGNQDGINNKNTASVSQYDIACFKVPER